MIYHLYRLVFPNGKYYFGITSNLKSRWHYHKVAARGKKIQTPVYRAMRKYGVDQVRMDALVCGDEKYIGGLEVAAIEHFRTRDNRYGYNVHLGGSMSPMLIPEVAKRVANTQRESGVHKGRKCSATHIAALVAGAAKYRINRTPEELARQVALANETRRKNRAALPPRPHKPRKSRSQCTKEYRDSLLAKARENSAAVKPGARWITDGSANRKVLSELDIPYGWHVGYTATEAFLKARALTGARRAGKRVPTTPESLIRLASARENSPMHALGARWVNDGFKQFKIRSGEPLPRGFQFGMMRRTGVAKNSAAAMEDLLSR